jgi:hypothetical protein
VLQASPVLAELLMASSAAYRSALAEQVVVVAPLLLLLLMLQRREPLWAESTVITTDGASCTAPQHQVAHLELYIIKKKRRVATPRVVP